MHAHNFEEDQIILGIDEAGRGPVIGPMVYSGAIISFSEHQKLVDHCQVADSKALTAKSRQSSLAKFDDLSSFHCFTVPVSASTISQTMLGRSGKTLNTLSHDTAMEIIRHAVLHCKGKLCAVFVDTVGPPESYQKLLAGRFPHLCITVSKKADSRFPIVSAASIVAKTTRDQMVEDLNLNVGSGYPSDPTASKWLSSNLDKFFGYPSDSSSAVRFSWAPVRSLLKKHCIDITFEADVKRDESQQKLTFEKTVKQDPIFAFTFGLKSSCGSLFCDPE